MATASDIGRLSGGRRGVVGVRPRPEIRLAVRTFSDYRRRTLAFSFLFAAVAYIQPVAYRHTYPTLSDRLAFAHSFADNKAIRLFYGVPHDLLSVGGYTAWRVGGILALFAAVWGSLAATAALRGEEDAGLGELVLAQPVSRRVANRSAYMAILAGAAVLFVVLWAAVAAAGLPMLGSAWLALAVCSVILVFAGVGAVASQMTDSRRRSLELAMGVMAVAFVIRVIADTVAGAGWLRWLTPLGWSEELRAFANPRPAVLLLPLATAAVLMTVAARIAERRDVGTGLLGSRDSRRSRLTLLSSPAAHALRSELATLAAWLFGIGAFAFIVGVISKSISSAGIPAALRHQLAKLGSGSVVTPKGYLGFSFLFFVVAISLFACSQVSAARGEELHGGLETVLAQPVGRRRWLLERLLVAAAGAALISLVAGLLAWAGAEAAGVSTSIAQMLLAAANCLSVALLFLGVGALGYAAAARLGAALAYGLVTVAFLWQLFSSLLGAPTWVVRLSPFAHIGYVPEQPFKTGWAMAFVLLGAAAGLAAAAVFARRDVVTG